MNCVDNLTKCNASCCRVIIFSERYLTAEFKEYYKAHGCTFERRGNRGWMIKVPMKCPNLGDDNLCKIHENKPKLCAKFDEKCKNSFYITEGCILDGK